MHPKLCVTCPARSVSCTNDTFLKHQNLAMDSQRNHAHLADPRLEYAFRAWGPSRFTRRDPNVAIADERDDEVAPEQIAAELARRKPLNWQDIGLENLEGGIFSARSV